MIFNPFYVNTVIDRFKAQRDAGQLGRAIFHFFEKNENAYRLKSSQSASTAIKVLIGDFNILDSKRFKPEQVTFSDDIIKTLAQYYLVYRAIDGVHSKDATIRFDKLFGEIHSNIIEDKRMLLAENLTPIQYQPIAYFHSPSKVDQLKYDLCSKKLCVLFWDNIDFVLEELDGHYQSYLNVKMNHAKQAFEDHLLDRSKASMESFGIAPPGYDPITHTFTRLSHVKVENEFKNEEKSTNNLEGISFMKGFKPPKNGFFG